MTRTTAGQRMALIRARLSLPQVRRAAGLFEGSHTSILTGKGNDFEDLTDYQPGDEVRDIDWKVSARAGKPIIRRFERDTDVFTQLLMDTSLEMRALAPSGEAKSAIALATAETLAYLASYRGDRVGLVYGNSAGAMRLPARHGLSHLDFVLDRTEHAFEQAQAETNVTAVVDYLLKTTRERSLVILVTDQFWPTPAAEFTLRRIRERHELMVVRIEDMPLTAEGVAAMADIEENLFLPEYVREGIELQREVQAERAMREWGASELLARYGVLNASLASSADILPVVVGLLKRQHHAK